MKINEINKNNITSFARKCMQDKKISHLTHFDKNFEEFSSKFSNAQRALGLSNINFKGNSSEDEHYQEKFEKIKQILDQKLEKDPDCVFIIEGILQKINPENISLALMMLEINEILLADVRVILGVTNKENKQAKEGILDAIKIIENFPMKHAGEIIYCTNEENISVAKRIVQTKDFPMKHAGEIICCTNEENISVAKRIVQTKDFPMEDAVYVLEYTNNENISLAHALVKTKEIPPIQSGKILQCTHKNNVEPKKQALQTMKELKDFPIENSNTILRCINENNFTLAQELLKCETFPQENIGLILSTTNKDKLDSQIELLKILNNTSNFPMKGTCYVLENTDKQNIKLKKEVLEKIKNTNDFPMQYANSILLHASNQTMPLIETIFNNKALKFLDIEYILAIQEKHAIEQKKEMLEIINNIKGFPIERANWGLQDIGYIDKKKKIYDFLSNKNCSELSKKVEKLKEILLNHPEHYISGEFENETKAIKQIEFFFDHYFVPLMALSDIFDQETMNTIMRMRIYDAEDFINDELLNLSTEQMELVKKLSNAKNKENKLLSSMEKLQFVALLNTYNLYELSTFEAEKMADEKIIDFEKLNINLLEHFLLNCELKKEEIAQIPKEKLFNWDISNLYLLLKELKRNDVFLDDKTILKTLVRASSLYNFGEFIHNKENPWGAANKKTEKLFEKHNLNYNAWINPPKKDEVRFVALDKNMERLEQIASQIEEDINELRKTPAKNFIDKNYERCIKEDNFLIPAEIKDNKKRLKDFASDLTTQLETIFKRAQGNISNPTKQENAQKTLTIKNHLQQRLEDISEVKNIESNTHYDLTIKMWDRIPQKDIFQGNYSTCCIGMGKENGSAMPHYLLNTTFNMIELIDNNTGISIGNALCYFAIDENSNKTFIIDNIEIKNSKKPSKEIGKKLREEIANYAKRITKEMSSDDIKIYMGSNYNDVECEDLEKRAKKISLLGEIECKSIYLDSFDGWKNKESLHNYHTTLLKLK